MVKRNAGQTNWGMNVFQLMNKWFKDGRRPCT